MDRAGLREKMACAAYNTMIQCESTQHTKSDQRLHDLPVTTAKG